MYYALIALLISKWIDVSNADDFTWDSDPDFMLMEPWGIPLTTLTAVPHGVNHSPASGEEYSYHYGRFVQKHEEIRINVCTKNYKLDTCIAVQNLMNSTIAPIIQEIVTNGTLVPTNNAIPSNRTIIEVPATNNHLESYCECGCPSFTIIFNTTTGTGSVPNVTNDIVIINCTANSVTTGNPISQSLDFHVLPETAIVNAFPFSGVYKSEMAALTKRPTNRTIAYFEDHTIIGAANVTFLSASNLICINCSDVNFIDSKNIKIINSTVVKAQKGEDITVENSDGVKLTQVENVEVLGSRDVNLIEINKGKAENNDDLKVVKSIFMTLSNNQNKILCGNTNAAGRLIKDQQENLCYPNAKPFTHVRRGKKSIIGSMQLSDQSSYPYFLFGI